MLGLGKQEGLSVLLVEDNDAVRELVTDALVAEGAGKVTVVDSGAAALGILCDSRPDRILTDWGLADGQTGDKVVSDAVRRGIYVAVLSGSANVKRHFEGLGFEGPVDMKPVADIEGFARRLLSGVLS
jgi:CheY-like chemotaxis protein